MKKMPKINKYILVLLLTALVCAALFSCAPQKHQINFESNGGNECLPLVIKGKHGIILPQPIRDGYRFDGWFFDDGQWTQQLTTTTYSKKRLKEDVTVYAKWTFVGYVVKFVTNGGSEVEPLIIGIGEKITAPPFTERQDYTFVGWCTDSALSNFYQLGTDINSSFTLYAKWLSNADLEVFDILFQPNNGDEVFSVQVVEGNPLTMPSISRIGYDFDGWYSDEALTVPYNSSEIVTTAFTLYAKWQRNSNMFRFRFETDGGSAVEDIWLQRSEILTPPTTTKANHTFIGWYTDADRTQVYDFNSGAAEDMILYAKWQENDPVTVMYKVTFISDGVTVFATELEEYSAVESHQISKTGYNFVGWYIDEELTQPYDFTNDNTITEDIVLYAKWAPSGGATDGSFTYELSGEYYTVTGFDGEGAVELPSEFNSLPVAEIADEVFMNKNITAITFSSNLKRIGIDAFNGSNVTHIFIPDTVESIGDRAFANCNYLTSAEIAGNPQKGSGLFSNSALSQIILHETMDNITADMFRNCDSLVSIVLPDSILTIAQGAFYDCGLLSQVTLGSGLESIEVDAFGNCFALSAIDFKNVKTIANRAFEGSGLTSVSLPDTITAIGQNAFGNCTKLATVAIGSGLTSMENSFLQSAVKTFSVSENSIAYCAIDGDLYTKDGKALLLYSIGKSQTQCNLPEGAEEIADFAFAFASNLQKLVLPSTMKVISPTAFVEMPNFSEFEAQGFLSAENGILYNADKTQLIRYPQNNPTQELVLPSNVEGFSPFAFMNASYLKKITLTNKISVIPDYAFYNAVALNEIILNGAPLVTLGEYAFYGCALLTEFIPPYQSLTTIGEYCFADSGLVYIGITTNVTHVGDRAFANCDSLEEVHIAQGIENLNGGIFYNCDALKEVHLLGSPLTIGNAFQGCHNIEKLVISGTSGVTDIAPGALPETTVLHVQQSVLAEYTQRYGDMLAEIKQIV
jgi:uncharacterized repeat protein (TIGR02543 family)